MYYSYVVLRESYVCQFSRFSAQVYFLKDTVLLLFQEAPSPLNSITDMDKKWPNNRVPIAFTSTFRKFPFAQYVVLPLMCGI